ncbi:MAG: flagellar M-ring protein FliF [Oscillibacter sp.]|nr:flagellar M-ring protein FliF [Oscillibacter sp.]
MADRIKQAWAKIRAFWVGLSRRTKAFILFVLAVTLVVVGILIVRSTNRHYSVLFTDLSSEDLTQVINYLSANNVTDYRIENNNRILVPEGQEARLKMNILLEGFPTSGFGYQMYLSNVGSLSSDADRQILWQADLQDRLAACISYIPGVRSAKVFITLGEDRRYILSTDDVVNASASVMVDMSGNKTLTDQQANAIRALVRRAVQGLDIDNIDITDSAGNTYTGETDALNANDSAQLKLALESQVNAYIRNNVLRVLNDMFGEGNASVSVSSTVNVSRTYEDSIIYEEPEWAQDGSTEGRGIIGRRLWGNSIVRDDGTGAGGTVGTTTNADLNEYVVNQSDLTGNEREINTSGELDYNVTQHHRQTEYPIGVVEDVMVSVAINSTVLGDTPPNLDTLTQIVARAAGINAQTEGDRIAIMIHPFYVTPPPPEEPTVIELLPGLSVPGWVLYAAVAGLILFAILVIVILLIRRSMRKRREERERRRREAELHAAELARLQPKKKFVIVQEDGTVTEVDEDTPGAIAVDMPEPVVTEDGEVIMPTLEDAVQQAHEKQQKAAELAEAAAELAEAQEEEGKEGADIMDINSEEDMELRKKVRLFVEENPVIAAQMLKTWIKGGGEEGSAAS